MTIFFFFWDASKKDLVLKGSQQGSKGQSILPKGLEKLACAKCPDRCQWQEDWHLQAAVPPAWCHSQGWLGMGS